MASSTHKIVNGVKIEMTEEEIQKFRQSQIEMTEKMNKKLAAMQAKEAKKQEFMAKLSSLVGMSDNDIKEILR